jgi:carbon-monoxide dehydrogenase small subunit
VNISFKLNDKHVSLDVSPELTLADLLRNELGLFGTKKGCGRGECGSCLVFMDKTLTSSCLVPAFRVDGTEIVTIEGFSETKEFQAIESGFEKARIVLCGYCAPGVVMAVEDLLSHNLAPGDDEIKEAISGNVCRCMGASGIVEAIVEAARLRSRRTSR